MLTREERNIERNIKKYIVLTAEDSSRVGAEARISAIDRDPARGGTPSVTFSTTVDCLEKKYVRASLCSEPDGDEIYGCDTVFEGGGETAEVSVTVRLKISDGDGTCFCSGDNPLIEFLLGVSELEDLRIGWGNCTYPSRPCVRNTELIDGFAPAVFSHGPSGFSFSSGSPIFGRELVLYAGDVSLLRALRPYTVSVKAYYGTVDGTCAINVGENAESVFNVSVDGATVLKADTVRTAERIVNVTPQRVVALGADGEVKSDPAGEYVAFISTTYVDVYKADSTDITKVLHVERNGEYVEICRGGSLALWGMSLITMYEPDDGGNYSSFTATVSSGSDNEIVREGNRYHCAFRRGLGLYRYVFDRNTCVKLGQESVNSALFFLSRCGDAIAYGDRTLRVKTTDSDISAQFFADPLTQRGAARSGAGVGDGFAFTEEKDGTYAYDFVHNNVTALGSGCRASGTFIYGGGKAYAYDYVNGIREIAGGELLAGATSACMAGDAVFAVKNGKLYVCYVSRGALTVRMPADKIGKQVMLNVRERSYIGLGKGAEFTLESEAASVGIK